MATRNTDPSTVTAGFGRVSRTVGTLFRYLLLAATLAGIVALGVLLLFVTNDAIRPLSASISWLATALVCLGVVPGAIAVWIGSRDVTELRRGASALGLLVVGVLYAGAVAVVFTDVIQPIPLFAYLVALLVPAGVLVFLERLDDRISFLVRVLAVAVTAGASFTTVPGWIQSLPILPADWVILSAALGGPVSVVVWWYVDRRVEDSTLAGYAGVGALAVPWAMGAIGVVLGLHPAALTVLGAIGLVPSIIYLGMSINTRGVDAIGVLLPFVAVIGLGVLLASEWFLGLAGPNAWLTWGFLTSAVAAPASEAGIYPGIAGTILLMIVVVVLSFPVGVGAAVYLEEYAKDTWFTRVIDVNIANLAGVPSVVYGLLGLGAFVRFGGIAPGTVLVGGMTLSLLILPIVIINSREAVRAVPDSRRQAAFGMGATRWQVVRSVVIPEAFPAILTGTILALGRAVGETAPLLVIGAPAIFGVPGQLGDRVGAIPLQIYTWASTFADEAFFTTVLAAGVLTILVVLLTMNSIAIVLRNKYQGNT